MLQQLEQLALNTDGRYATDAELSFFQDYLKTARLRFALYQKIQKIEKQIIQQVLVQIKTANPDVLMSGTTDMTAKWQRDTVRTIRYAATALLVNAPERYKERMLLWFQPIMKSFKAERSCEATYRAMQTVVKQMLSHEEAALFCPLLEMSRSILGNTSQ